jgi:hypothetical protein
VSTKNYCFPAFLKQASSIPIDEMPGLWRIEPAPEHLFYENHETEWIFQTA